MNPFESLLLEFIPKTNDFVDLNDTYDEIVTYFLNTGLAICDIRFYFQILLLFPCTTQTEIDVISAFTQRPRMKKWTWDYLCSTMITYDNQIYCAIFLDWGSKAFTKSLPSHFDIKLNGMLISPVMIKIKKKGLKPMKKLFSVCAKRYYILRSDLKELFVMHNEEDTEIIYDDARSKTVSTKKHVSSELTPVTEEEDIDLPQ